MIEEPTMLVVSHDQCGLIPQIGVRSECIIDVRDQMFSEANILRRMLRISVLAGRIDKSWEDERVVGQVALRDILRPPVIELPETLLCHFQFLELDDFVKVVKVN